MMASVKDWKVEEEKMTLSDYNYITFKVFENQDRREISKRKGNPYPSWKIKKMDEDMFVEAMEWKVGTYKGIEELKEEENGSEWLQSVVMEAADLAMPRVKKLLDKKQVHWWNEDIAQKKKQCIESRRRWTRARRACKRKNGELMIGETDKLEKIYREKKKELVEKIYKAKVNSWKSLIKEIDDDPWGILYKLVMNRLRCANPRLTELLEIDKVNRLVCF